MRPRTSLWTVIPVSLLLAACSGSSAATPWPASGGGTGGGATSPAQTAGGTEATAPTSTDASGGGGAGSADFSHGKAHVEIAGGATRTIDLGFVAIASHFGGTDQSFLTYSAPTAVADVMQAFTVVVANGTTAFSYVSTDLTVTGVECASSDLKIDATSASGSFSCTKTYAVLSSGASTSAVTMKGTFDAHG